MSTLSKAPVKAYAALARIATLVGLLLTLFLGATAAGATPFQGFDPDFAAIDVYIEAQMKSAGIPGVALAIVHAE